MKKLDIAKILNNSKYYLFYIGFQSSCNSLAKIPRLGIAGAVKISETVKIGEW